MFWDYFKKELRFPAIFRPGPLAMLADGAAGLLDTVREIIIQLRDQFFPLLCETEQLKRFAAARGIVRAPLEAEDYWLSRVKFAYLFWAMGGRASSLAEALCKSFDFTSVDIINLGASDALIDETTAAPLFDETSGEPLEYVDEGRWAEFVVIVYMKTDAPQYIQEQVIWAINDVKPARSKLAAIMYIAPLWDETTGAPLYDETSGALLTN